MVRIAHIVIAFFPVVLSAQDNPLSWFPLQVGSQWLYENEWKSGDPDRPSVERWTTEESITGWVTIPEGLVVLREVRRHSKTPGEPTRVLGSDGQAHQVQFNSDGADVVARQKEPFLVRGSCVYVINNGFDNQSRKLSPTYQKSVREQALSPDFCFPLEMERRWGNTDIPWRVEPARSDARSSLAAGYPNATHIVSDHFGSGGRKDVWFQKGIGVVGERYYHNGSYDEYTKKLVSFRH
jgi:hypothetical protein